MMNAGDPHKQGKMHEPCQGLPTPQGIRGTMQKGQVRGQRLVDVDQTKPNPGSYQDSLELHSNPLNSSDTLGLPTKQN